MPKNFYVTHAVEQLHVTTSNMETFQLNPSGFADGCVGFIPVFTNKKKAMRYANGKDYPGDLTRFEGVPKDEL